MSVPRTSFTFLTYQVFSKYKTSHPHCHLILLPLHHFCTFTSTAHAITQTSLSVVYMHVCSREVGFRSESARMGIFTSHSHWTIKAGTRPGGPARGVSRTATDLWLPSNRIFASAVHKSQAELLTVNWPCQDVRLIPRLCQAIEILCISTKHGLILCTYTVNGRIRQRGFVSLEGTEARSLIYY